ncbi:MAG: class I SAM-dependent methyltransferase [Candidatus Kerfeldbacteria bacterium]|nr:class I SAM-dependent methyltransferase [Candidatus Kerfeldbacteria bacterium]
MTKTVSWDKVAEWWDRAAGETGVWHQEHDIDPVVRRLLGRVKSRVILEIGCGNGYFSRQLARAGAEVTAIDKSKKFVSLAQEKKKRHPLRIHYLQHDAVNLKGLGSLKFDIVLANMVLMDVPHFHQVMKEVARVLKSSGRFVFSIVHPLYSDWQHAVVSYKGKKYYARVLKKYMSETDNDRMHWKSGHATIHYHRPLQSYIHALRDAGFLVRDIYEIRTSRKLVRAPSAGEKNRGQVDAILHFESRQEVKAGEPPRNTTLPRSRSGEGYSLTSGQRKQSRRFSFCKTTHRTKGRGSTPTALLPLS